MPKNKNIIQSRQIKAGRALLNWSQEDLAKTAKVSVATIRKLEMGTISPRPATMGVIHDAFVHGGLEFVEPGGVRYLPEETITYQGHEGLNAFLDDVYQTAKKKVGEIVTVCSKESPFMPSYIADTKFYTERMGNLKDKVITKCILTENAEALDNQAHVEYRIISPLCNTVPFYVYGHKCALSINKADHMFKIVVLQSADIAQGFRKQFQSMWEKAIPSLKNSKKSSASEADRLCLLGHTDEITKIFHDIETDSASPSRLNSR